MPGELKIATEEGILRQAEVLALRQMSDTMRHMSASLERHSEALVEIKVDIATIKARQERDDETREMVKAMQVEIDELKERNAKQDGAFDFVAFLKDFGPWVVMLVLFAASIFKK